jgi:predicted dehydrogenase
VLVEKPPGLNAREARRVASAATKSGKVLLYAFQRRFGGAEQSAKQAIARGYAGHLHHVRASWLRTRGVPHGTGWFGDKARSGGGAMIDLGCHMLDLAWWLMDQPKPLSVFAAAHLPSDGARDVEDSAFALIRFEGGRSLELGAAWALNQPPQQQGTQCRLFGTEGCVDVYTPQGAVIYRQFDAKGQSKPTVLKPPRLTGHAALMRHYRDCILGKAQPLIGGAEGVVIMEILDAIYKSARSGKSVAVG